MAGKKKKKPSANPARGFATVSQPSKAKDTAQDDDETPSQSQEPSVDSLANGDHSVEHLKAGKNADEVKSIAEMTPDELEAHLEDSELRNLVEQHSTRIKTEATRQANRLQNERRQLRQQADQASIYGLTDMLIDDILQDSLQTESDILKASKPSSPPGLEETELLQKLWLLQEVLKHLKVKMLDEALTHVLHVCRKRGVAPTQNSVWGLEEALTWIAGLSVVDENLAYDPDHITENDSADNAHLVADTKDSFENTTPPDDARFLSADAAVTSTDTVSQADGETTSSDEDDDPDNLVERWLRLRARLFERNQGVNTNGPDLPQPSGGKLTDKIRRIERDVLFDTDLAQQRWQVILKDLEIESARARKQTSIRTAAKGTINLDSGSSSLHEIDEDDVLGNIFDGENADNQPQSTADSVESISHHDFGSWTGVNPQKLLEETCTGFMARDGVRFRPFQTTSYSARSNLHMKFASSIDIDSASVECAPRGIACEQTTRSLILRMIATTTRNVQQSNAYLATIAIFLLISAGAINAKIALRLPKVWKELLNELASTRDELVLRNDICKLKHIRGMIRSSSQPRDIVPGSFGQPRVRGEGISSKQTFKHNNKDSADQAKLKWSERAASKQYALMQPTRQNLPVHAFKSEILQAFYESPILIICADTGAGKSTQIPSYILENALCSGQDYRIMVTQPRRISAISIARRVSSELGEDNSALGTTHSLIGYAIRMESKVSHTTRVTFVTTGVLLRMLQGSPNLDHLDCLILDEVHERTMDLDLLFIALKRLRKRRDSLKIVLMSATVDATKFSSYFDNAPVLDIPGRTFPVQVGYLEDAIEATLDVTDGGERLNNIEDEEPAGLGDEVDQIHDAPSGLSSELEKYSPTTQKTLTQYDQTRLNYQLILGLAIAIATKPEFTKFSKAVLIFVPGISEIRRLHSIMLSTKTFSRGWVVHMLHSSFSTQELEKAFLLPPAGCRKIVIATNIAETGITIPDVTAVIDTCKEKIMRFDERRQVSRLTEGFIARASARQRKGRAARVQDGLCFHLVTRHHFESKLQDQPTPEMLRLSLQEPILRIKVWGLGSAEDILSEALDPPSMKNARRALVKLQDVGALDSSEKLTVLGKCLAKLPLDVAMGKMAILGVFLQSLDAVITIIASFSVKSIFANDNSAASLKEFARGDSDLLTIYNAYSGWKKAHKQGTAQQFAQRYRLNQFQLRQLEEQKIQLFNYLVDAGLMSLGSDEYAALHSARNSRSNQYFDVPARYNQLSSDSVINAITAMAFYPKLLRREGQGYRNVYSNQQLQIAPTSINRMTSKPPEWLCYLEAIQTKNGRLNAFHSSKVAQAVLVLLLGQADFKYFAGVIDIDHGRIRLSLRRWREILALQHLRFQIHRVMFEFLARPESPMSPADQVWLDMIVRALDGSSQPGAHLPEQLLRSQQI